MLKNILKAGVFCCALAAELNSADTNSTAVVDPPIKMTRPFEDPLMHSIGTVLMFVLIALSNAGGLSGAGSNIPIMLICFTMDMKEAVPISGFVAVVATVMRFVLGFNKKHPHSDERTAINYEVV